MVLLVPDVSHETSDGPWYFGANPVFVKIPKRRHYRRHFGKQP